MHAMLSLCTCYSVGQGLLRETAHGTHALAQSGAFAVDVNIGCSINSVLPACN